MNINLEVESLESIHALVEHVAGSAVAKIVTEFAEARHPRKSDGWRQRRRAFLQAQREVANILRDTKPN